jgi:DNA-binding transcriptional MerR regulator
MRATEEAVSTGAGTTATGPRDGVPIATVSRALGVPIPTIRSWERRYGFPAPTRTGGRHRRYADEEIEQLRRVRDLIVRGHPARDAVARVAAGDDPSRGDELADALVAAALRLDVDSIRTALDDAADRLGVEAAIRDVAFAAMHEIGTRWKAGRCDVEQEHLASQTVRTWLGRHAALAPPASRRRPIVLACGPKDLHTIGVEAFGVVLARRGWPVRLLGAMTPADALVSAVTTLRAAAAVVTAQRSVTRRAAIGSLAAIERLSGVPGFYAGDAFLSPSARRDVPGTYLGEDVAEAAAILESHLRTHARAAATP